MTLMIRMLDIEKYEFSFTASSLRLKEMILVAKATSTGSSFDFVNELGAGKASTGKRMYSEFNKRLVNLNDDQMKFLLSGDLVSQKQIALVSICKTYSLIREFVIEVLREKLLSYDYHVTDGDYISFIKRKMDLHDELEALTDLTKSKIKQVMFKILEQTGLINDVKSRIIQPQIIDKRLLNVIMKDNPEWLKVLLLSDMDIEKGSN